MSARPDGQQVHVPVFFVLDIKWRKQTPLEKWTYAKIRIYFRVFYALLFLVASTSKVDFLIYYFYWTRVRSLVMLVTDWLTNWLTDSLTDCRLVSLIDVGLACEDGNSKLVEVVTVADVDSEDHVGNSLLQIWELTFGPKTKLFQTLSTRVGQDFEVEVQQDFETGACSAFCRWCFVEVMKLNLGRYSEARLGQDFEF